MWGLKARAKHLICRPSCLCPQFEYGEQYCSFFAPRHEPRTAPNRHFVCNVARQRRVKLEPGVQVLLQQSAPTGYWPSIFQYNVYVLVVSTWLEAHEFMSGVGYGSAMAGWLQNRCCP